MINQMTKRASAVFAAALLALTGCSGEDGAAGAAGAPGQNGQDGQDGTSCTVQDNGNGTATITCTDGTVATVVNGADGADGSNGTSCTVQDNGNGTTTISCADGTSATVVNGTDGVNGQSCAMTTNSDGTRTITCPDGGSVVLPAISVAGNVDVTDQTVAVDGNDVVITYKVKLDGVASSAFINKVSSYRWGLDATIAGDNGYRRTSIAVTDYAVSVAAGTYTIRLPGMATTIGTTPTMFMMRVDAGAGSPQADVIVSTPSVPKAIAGDQACINCHGNYVFRGGHHGANPEGVAGCVVCHVRADSSESRLGTSTNLTTNVAGTAPGTRLMGYVHGIHNSHNMPDGVYSRNGSTTASSQFSIGFPSYMNNCSICHDTQESLDLVLSKPVSFQTCMSCHDNWDGFAGEPAGHAAYTNTQSCTGCHGGGVASTSTVGDFHGKRQMYTGRNGLLYDGKDQSIEQGKRIVMTIDSVTPGAGTLAVTWSATLDGAAIDPCNQDVAAGPVFFGLAANAATGQSGSNMSLLQAYAQGNDWVNAGIGTSPGQPISENLAATNTTCAANVATSTIAAAATTATKGVVSLQGKPQVTFTSGAYTRVIQVRSTSPAREFVVADGTDPVVKRRKIVSNEKCLACHPGSLYQHGGNRIDSVDLCVTCHNPASNDRNWRDTYGVDSSEAYDGRDGMTYDLRYMVHAIHSAGATNAPWVLYRGNNGIYAFGSQAAIDALPNWPGAGSQVVYGSDTALDGTPKTADTKNHTEVVVHYPRPLNECGACHVEDEVTLPSTLDAMAVTLDAGGTTYGDQVDDVLLSPAAASCMSCHQSGDRAFQAALQGHAFQNSWMPQVFTNGRADIIGGGAYESCLLCHGAGSVSDFNAAHAK